MASAETGVCTVVTSGLRDDVIVISGQSAGKGSVGTLKV